MKEAAKQIEQIKIKYEQLKPFFNERVRRIWCATEENILGYGGVTVIHEATGVTRKTIHKGLEELKLKKIITEPERIRHKGAGHKRISEKDTTLLNDLNERVVPAKERKFLKISIH